MKFIKSLLVALLFLALASPVLAGTVAVGGGCNANVDCDTTKASCSGPSVDEKKGSCALFGLSGQNQPSGTGLSGQNAACDWNSGTALCNPLKANTPQELIGIIINGLLGIVGSLALIMFIYGGFLWMTSAGKEASIEKGKNILLWSTLGLIVIFLSYALVRFVLVGIGA